MRAFLQSLVVAAVSLAPVSGFAGPFGFSMGQDPTSISGGHLSGNAVAFTGKTVPRAHPELDSYFAYFAPGIGICRIIGMAQFDDNFSGIATKSRFSALEAQLTEKYGAPAEKLDLLIPGALYAEDSQWLKAVFKGERMMRTQWVPAGDTEVREVFLRVIAPEYGDGGVFVEYRLFNVDTCEKAWEDAKKDVL